jgi:hypothetical protein
MGNIDCKNFGKNTDVNEIQIGTKVCVRIGSISKQIIDVKGDHEQIEPETKRNQ